MALKKRVQLINNNRPGRKITPTSVTIHNTANPNSTAQNNRDYFANHPNARASAQWVVDDREAIQCIPEGEEAWHAGMQANKSSVGIEVCEFTDANRQRKADDNAAALVADILMRYGWGVDRIKTHKDWTGKNCPRKLIPMWAEFIVMAEAKMRPALPPMPKKIVPTLVNDEATGQTHGAYIIDGTTYAPVRAIAEAAGLQVDYDDKIKRTTLRR